MTSLIVLVIVYILSVLAVILSVCEVGNSPNAIAQIVGKPSALQNRQVGVSLQNRTNSTGEVEGDVSEQEGNDSITPMERADERYEQYSDFIQRVNKHPTLNHLGNEKKLFSLLTAYDYVTPPKRQCFSIQGTFFVQLLPIDAIDYLQKYNESLLVHCKDNRTLSHCQQYYLFRYDTRNQICEHFYRKECTCRLTHSKLDLYNTNYTGATVATQISYLHSIIITLRLNRVDRLPFLISRWGGLISLAVFLDESELPRLFNALNSFTSQRRIVFSFYVRKQITPSIIPTFIASGSRTLSFKDGIYPMNILRDMAIESIETTHYVLLDIDIFTSSTLGQDIMKNRALLNDHHNILLIPLFEMINTKEVLDCKSTGSCVHMYALKWCLSIAGRRFL